MAMADRERTCFVVMPFGEKKDHDGRDIDFDDLYRFFLKRVVEDLKIKCVRCDEIEEAGSIHQMMFQQIYTADVVVVDITTSNPNVYYELGVRHALAKGVTVLIRRKGTTVPFNIQGLQVVEYDQAKFGSVEQAKARIRQIIENGLAARKNDSPVHDVLELNIEPEGKPLEEMRVYEARLKGGDDVAVGLITGDIQNVKDVDVWVNTENTNMQMARPFENSISGLIRYLGAEKDKENGQIKTDTIAIALAAKMNGRPSVDPATILVTESGAMWESHGVKRILHAAANYGQVGQGYIPIDYVARCVVNALKACREDAGACELRSILFPLMATRSRRGAVLEDRVRPLLNAAVEYLSRNPDCPFRRVYFLTYTDKELRVCEDLLRVDNRLEPLHLTRPPAEAPVPEPEVTPGVPAKRGPFPPANRAGGQAGPAEPSRPPARERQSRPRSE